MLPVSVIVPTYNRGGVLIETLQKLMQCDGTYGIIVVDQSPPPNDEAHRLAGYSLIAGRWGVRVEQMAMTRWRDYDTMRRILVIIDE